MSLYRVEKLIDLACSTTHEEEARTAALAACRLIRRQGIRLSARAADPWAASAFDRNPPRSPAPEAPRPAPKPPRQKPPNGGTWSKATRSGRCDNCADDYAYGDDVYTVLDAVWCAHH